MTSYLRPDDGIAPEAEMVEIRPGQSVNAAVARQLGLAVERLQGGRREIRAEPATARASEVVGGFGGDCSATVHAERTPPGADPVNKPPVGAEQPGPARPRRSAGQQTRLKERDGAETLPPEVASAPPAAPEIRAAAEPIRAGHQDGEAARPRPPEPSSPPGDGVRRPGAPSAPKRKRSLAEILADCP